MTEPITFATIPSNNPWGQAYAEICGDDNYYRWQESITSFVRTFGGQDQAARRLTMLRNEANLPLYRHFLDRGSNCPEGTPGINHYAAMQETLPLEAGRISQSAPGTIQITTNAGDVIINLGQTGSQPRIAPINSVMFNSASYQLNDVLNLGRIVVIRIDSLTVGIFADGEYLGQVSAVSNYVAEMKKIAEPANYIGAWANYLGAFLTTAELLIYDMRLARGNSNITPQELKHFTSDIRLIQTLVSAMEGFKREDKDPFYDSWPYNFVMSEIAQLKNAVTASYTLLYEIETEGTGETLNDALDGLEEMFDPAYYLGPAFVTPKDVRRFVRVASSLPEKGIGVEPHHGFFLRRILGTIIVMAGFHRQNEPPQILVGWDEKTNSIIVSEVNPGALASFTQLGNSSRQMLARLNTLARGGAALAISYEYGDFVGEHAPLSIVIGLPALLKIGGMAPASGTPAANGGVSGLLGPDANGVPMTGAAVLGVNVGVVLAPFSILSAQMFVGL